MRSGKARCNVVRTSLVIRQRLRGTLGFREHHLDCFTFGLIVLGVRSCWHKGGHQTILERRDYSGQGWILWRDSSIARLPGLHLLRPVRGQGLKFWTANGWQAWKRGRKEDKQSRMCPDQDVRARMKMVQFVRTQFTIPPWSWMPVYLTIECFPFGMRSPRQPADVYNKNRIYTWRPLTLLRTSANPSYGEGDS